MIPHIEDVGEVGLDFDFQQDPHGIRRIVRQVIVIVDAFEDGALETKPDRSFGKEPIDNRARGRAERKLRRHELVSRGKMLNGDDVEQQRWPAVDGDAVPADESGMRA